VVNFDRSHYLPDYPASAIFHQQGNGTWRQVAGTEDPRLARLPIEVTKRESINQPPQLVAEDKATRVTHTIWDPNPQLKDIELGSGEVIQWKDDTGYEWEAGLVRPPDYAQGKRCPLVIQTHGFSKGRFLSSGSFAEGGPRSSCRLRDRGEEAGGRRGHRSRTGRSDRFQSICLPCPVCHDDG
jgi:hypothetical protein